MTEAIVPHEVQTSNALLGEPTDALRDLFTNALNTLMQHEVTSRLSAGNYERHADRQGQRNGTRSRRFDTRISTPNLDVPRIRDDSYMPSFLNHRERCEAAITSLVHEAYVGGMSTRKIENSLRHLESNRYRNLKLASSIRSWTNE